LTARKHWHFCDKIEEKDKHSKISFLLKVAKEKEKLSLPKHLSIFARELMTGKFRAMTFCCDIFDKEERKFKSKFLPSRKISGRKESKVSTKTSLAFSCMRNLTAPQHSSSDN